MLFDGLRGGLWVPPPFLVRLVFPREFLGFTLPFAYAPRPHMLTCLDSSGDAPL